MKHLLTPAILDLYLSLGRELFPLKPNDKTPLHKQWRQRKYTPNELLGYTKRGCNIGWRLGPTDCVIDIDPRNGGKDGRRVLQADLGVYDLADIYPTVQTGGGGWHYYTTLPERISIHKNIEHYGRGIDFLGMGRYVLIAGCSHPSGTPYRPDDFSPFQNPPPQIPNVLFEKIARVE